MVSDRRINVPKGEEHERAMEERRPATCDHHGLWLGRCYVNLNQFCGAIRTRLDDEERSYRSVSNFLPKNWGQSVTLVKASGKVRTLSPETQSMYSQRMLENTEKRVFYLMKSAPGARPFTTYMVSVPGEGFHCTGQLVVQPSYPENEVKKIVATFTAT